MPLRLARLRSVATAKGAADDRVQIDVIAVLPLLPIATGRAHHGGHHVAQHAKPGILQRAHLGGVTYGWRDKSRIAKERNKAA